MDLIPNILKSIVDWRVNGLLFFALPTRPETSVGRLMKTLREK